MKAIKIIFGLLLVIVLVVGGSLYWLSGNINGLVKSAIEDVGTETLNTAVTVDSVDIQLKNSSARIHGLKIANPQGFSQTHALKLGQVFIDINPESLLDKTININEILIDGAVIVAEQKGLNTNLNVLQKNIESLDQGSSESPQVDSHTATDDVLIKVGLFRFVNSAAQLHSDQWGQRAFSVPDISLSKLGGKAGVPPAQMADAILKPVIKTINRSLKNLLKQILKEKAGVDEEQLKQKLEQKLEEKLGGKSDAAMGKLKSLLSR